MKKYLKILLTLLLLYIPSVVYGAELSNFKLEIVTLDRIVDAPGDELTLKVSLSTTNVDTSITECKFKMNASSNSQFVSFAGANGWSDTLNGQEYVLTSETGIKSTSAETEASVIIGNAKFTVNGESTVTFSDITCTSDNGSTGNFDDFSVNLGVASTDDDITVKIDGINVPGGIHKITPATKESFVLVLSSQNTDTLSNVSVKAKNTLSGDKLLCDSSSLSNCVINFANDNFCVSGDSCIGVKSSEGDVILLSIEKNGSSIRELFVTRQLQEGQDNFYTDSSISYLNVYGNEIVLVEGQTKYETVVYGEKEEYSVVANLSDPEHYQWGDEDNPSKYNFRTEYILLQVIPKDNSMLGANDRTYEITVIFQDEIAGSESAASSSSVKPSSSHQSNPQTGGVASIIVAVILFASLIYSLRTYNKTMEQ